MSDQTTEQPAPAPETTPQEPGQEKRGFFRRMKDGLSRSSARLSDGISGIFTKKKLDAETLDDLEDLLISSDLGLEAAAELAETLSKDRFNKEISPEEVRAALADEIAQVLDPVAKPLVVDPAARPFVMLMVGVNGSGKTTTIGKLAAQFAAEGRKVLLAAGDTFRAAAVEQLKVWGHRTNAPVVTTKIGGDAAGLAFEAIERAKAENMDVVMIDTAGRLQNKADLMAELEKVVRVIRKVAPDAPHATILVLDATTGQNAINQVEVFQKAAPVSGLVMTKLDGTAKGGILVAVSKKFGLPVHAIGVGEGIDDLHAFEPMAFARAITGGA